MADPGSQAVGVASTAPPGVGHEPRRAGVLLGAVIGVVILAPLIAFGVWALTTAVRSGGDVALTEIAVRDVGGAHTPLLGAYSRYHWHHPGPLFLYVLAVPYRLLGRDGSALAAGAVLLNALAVAGSALVLWRRGRVGGLVVGGLATTVFLHSLGGDVLASPWNPVATVLPMLLLVLLVWSVLCGDAWLLPIVVGVGTVVLQTHVGAAGVAAVSVLTAAVAVFVSRRARHGDRRVWIVSIAVGVVLWIPPVVDALAHRGGNLRALVDFWTAVHDHVTGWARAARIVGAELALAPPWITGRLPRKGFLPGVDPGWTVPVLAIVFAAALLVAARRRRSEVLRLGAVTIGFALVAWVSVARIVDEPFDYLLRWTELTGVLVGLTVGWTVLDLVRAMAPARRRRVGGALGGLALAVTLGFAVVTSVRAFDGVTELDEQRIYDRLAPRLARSGPTLPAPVVVTDRGGLASAGLASSVLNGLLGAGVDAGFRHGFAWQVGRAHVVDHGRARTRMLVVFGDDGARLALDPRYRVVAAADELDPAERAELERLEASFTGFADELRWSRAHPARARRLAELARRSARAVVLVERG